MWINCHLRSCTSHVCGHWTVLSVCCWIKWAEEIACKTPAGSEKSGTGFRTHNCARKAEADGSSSIHLVLIMHSSWCMQAFLCCLLVSGLVDWFRDGFETIWPNRTARSCITRPAEELNNALKVDQNDGAGSLSPPPHTAGSNILTGASCAHHMTVVQCPAFDRSV